MNTYFDIERFKKICSRLAPTDSRAKLLKDIVDFEENVSVLKGREGILLDEHFILKSFDEDEDQKRQQLLQWFLESQARARWLILFAEGFFEVGADEIEIINEAPAVCEDENDVRFFISKLEEPNNGSS